MLGYEMERFLTGLQPKDHHYGRPTDADKQSIGAGHIGHGIGRVLRVFPGTPREIHVDGVLGKNGDQSEKRDRQCLRNILLDQLNGPKQHESGAENRNTRAKDLPVQRRMPPEKVYEDPLKTKQGR